MWGVRNCEGLEELEDLKDSNSFDWGILMSVTKKGNLENERKFLWLCLIEEGTVTRYNTIYREGKCDLNIRGKT